MGEYSMVELAKKYAQQQYEVSKIKKPSIRDFKGADAYKQLSIAMKELTLKVDENFNLYCEGVSRFGDNFKKEVEKERKEIGRKYFGFN